jgi:hypothetical protein
MFKIMQGKAPRYLSELIPNLVQDRTSYQLRNREQIDVPLTRLNILTNSFFPQSIRLWNEMDNAIKNLPSVDAFKAFHARNLPKKTPLYYFGERLSSCIHARMRIGNSPLKVDLCNILHVVESPNCPCGTGALETAEHFFFACPLFDRQRVQMNEDMSPFLVDDINHVLYGIPNSDHLVNLHIFSAVHKYIRDTKRFF